MFVIFRLGVHIPVPGVDSSVIESLFTSGNLFGFLDLFAGGALSKFSIFAMSITPYINSSIIMQLLTAVIPTLEEWRKDGAEGYKKIQKVTRYFTIFLAAVQAFGMTYALRINNALVDNSWLYFFLLSLSSQQAPASLCGSAIRLRNMVSATVFPLSSSAVS